MQKFGILYLDHGVWNGQQVISKEWIDCSFTPWNRSSPNERSPDYGWFWWTDDYGPGWKVLLADGWKGQRIAVIPEQGLVITMTACIEDGTDHAFFAQLVKKVVMPSVRKGKRKAIATTELAALLAEVRGGPSRMRA